MGDSDLVELRSVAAVRKGDDEEDGDGNEKTRPRIVPRDQAPVFMHVHSPHLNHGFRIGHTPWNAVCSVFQLHNETPNIWSHLLPVPLFVVMSLDLLGRMNGTTQLQRAAVVVWTGSVVFCMLGSVTYHTFRCVSKRVELVLLQVDVLGIIVLITCSFFPPLTLAFECNLAAFFAYASVISLIALVGAVVMLNSVVHESESQVAFVVLPVLMVLSSVAPLVHFQVEHYGDPITGSFYLALGESFSAYVVGLICYVRHVPERVMSQGACDVFMHSHACFHICVVIGVALHYKVIGVLLGWATANTC